MSVSERLGDFAHTMIRDPLPRKLFAATVCGFAFVEWFLFELLRAPYRPPHDMTTFLGTEKYGVMAVMIILAVCGFGLVWSWAVRSTWTRRDVITLAVLVTVLIGAGSVVIIAPRWPVTPFHLFLK